MKKRLGSAFWVESILASAAALLAVITLAWPHWIEESLAVDPDLGNGSFEWTFVFFLCLSASVFTVMARREWRNAPLASA